MMKLIIKGGEIVTHEQTYKADVLCVDGKIQDIGQHLETPTDAEIVDATGKLVMPGGIDPHTYCNCPLWGQSQQTTLPQEQPRHWQGAPPPLLIL
ncbi:hypothetical protein P4S72_30015 [Vibrio sp. PP-XX7]